MKTKKKILTIVFIILIIFILTVTSYLVFLYKQEIIFLPSSTANYYFKPELKKVVELRYNKDDESIIEDFEFPQYLDENKFVCFWKYKNNKEEKYTQNQEYLIIFNTNGEIEILDGEVYSGFYSISHNRKYMVYSRFYSNFSTELYIYDFEKKLKKKFLKIDVGKVVWDLNDEYIIFTKDDCIFKVNIKTNTMTNIFSSNESIYINDVNNNNDIIITLVEREMMMIVDLDGNKKRIIKPYGGYPKPSEPILINFSFSPNFRFIAFPPKGLPYLKIYDLSKNKTYKIYQFNFDFFDKVTWSNDSEKLFFIQKDDKEKYYLYEIKIPHNIIKK